MKCTSCRNEFDPEVTLICPYCGMDHKAILMTDSPRLAQERERGPARPRRAAPPSGEHLTKGEAILREQHERAGTASSAPRPPMHEAPASGSAPPPRPRRPAPAAPAKPTEAPAPDAEVETAVKLAHEAEQCRRRGQLERAEKLACKGLVHEPDNVQLLTILGRVLYDRGDKEGALEEWRTALQIDPLNTHLLERVQHVEREIGIDPSHQTTAAAVAKSTGVQLESITRGDELLPGPDSPTARPVSLGPRIAAAYLVGIGLACLSGWVIGLVEVAFYRLHLIIPCVLGFLVGRYLEIASQRVSARQSVAMSARQRGICGAVLVLIAYVVALYVPYSSARHEVQTRWSRPAFFDQFQAKHGVSTDADEDTGLSDTTAPVLQSGPPEVTGTATIADGSFFDYLRGVAAQPLDFYRLVLPGSVFWLLLAAESMIALLVALSIGGVFN